MIYTLFSLFGIFRSMKHKSIALYLFILFFLSSLSAIVVGRQPILSGLIFLYIIYVNILLFVAFYSYKDYYFVRDINLSGINVPRLLVIEKLTIFMGIIALCAICYILSKIYPFLLSGYIDVNEFKNEGGVASLSLFSQSVPHFLITILNILSPLGYFFLSLHFYYLITAHKRKALIFFVLSMLIPLSGLISLSRSSTVSFILLYIGMLFLFFPTIGKKIKKRILMFCTILLLLIGSAFLFVSKYRFSDFYTKNSNNIALLNENKNPVLFSICDYFSQWEENGITILQTHKQEYNCYGLFNSSGLALFILQRIYGVDAVNDLHQIRVDEILGDQQINFHGIIPRLVYDFGFVGTVLFIIIYCFLVRRNRPRAGCMKFKSLLFLPLFLPFCTFFFQGNAYSDLTLDIAVVYNLILYLFLKNSPYSNK